jgi:hypothetical protein
MLLGFRQMALKYVFISLRGVRTLFHADSFVNLANSYFRAFWNKENYTQKRQGNKAKKVKWRIFWALKTSLFRAGAP